MKLHRFVVNGRPVGVCAAAETPLLYVLRNDLGLMGTRFGCGQGLCGTCTVLVDEVDVHSCQFSVGEADGRSVTTIEGLSQPDGQPGRVQQALIDRRAGQCGYCLSGIAVRIEAGLRAGDDRGRLLARLAQNRCRCGAHVRILRAIDDLLGEHAPCP